MTIDTKDELLKELLYRGVKHGGEVEVGIIQPPRLDDELSDELREELLELVEEDDG